MHEGVNFFSDCRQLVEQPQLLHAGHEWVSCAQLQEPHDYSSGGVLGVRLILFHSAATDGCWVIHVIRTSKLLGLILNRLIYNSIVWLFGQEATWALRKLRKDKLYSWSLNQFWKWLRGQWYSRKGAIRGTYIMLVEIIEHKGNFVSLFGSGRATLAGFFERGNECSVPQRTAYF